MAHQHEPDSPHRLLCTNGHEEHLTASKLQDRIDARNSDCGRCAQSIELEDPSDLTLECYVCSNVFEVGSLQEAIHTSDEGCGHCKQGGSIHISPCLPDSWTYCRLQFEWARQEKSIKDIRRFGRTDYWHAVVHFCKASEFVEIQRTGLIKAATTGFFYRPAVCLTEVPLDDWAEIRRRHGEFGFVFTKSDVLRLGGGPALYMQDALIEAQANRGGFADDVKPFVNVIRDPTVDKTRRLYNFSHEREWRVPGDIALKTTVPYGIVRGSFDRETPGWDMIWKALMTYDELEGDKAMDAESPDAENEGKAETD